MHTRVRVPRILTEQSPADLSIHHIGQHNGAMRRSCGQDQQGLRGAPRIRTAIDHHASVEKEAHQGRPTAPGRRHPLLALERRMTTHQGVDNRIAQILAQEFLARCG